MKLKNKKTGEIGELKQWWNRKNRNINGVGVYVSPDIPLKQYNSLAKLNDEWEDYEEPKEYWLIDWTSSEGIDKFKEFSDDVDIFNKSIGNYFETREEAEKAVEKLKAWKRLKDKNFHFLKYSALGCGEIEFRLDFEDMDDEGEIGELQHDLDLLFGGEE